MERQRFLKSSYEGIVNTLCLLTRNIHFARQPLEFRTEEPLARKLVCYVYGLLVLNSYLVHFFLWWNLSDFSLPTSFDAVFQGGRLTISENTSASVNQ
jgi:hypothetical protein